MRTRGQSILSGERARTDYRGASWHWSAFLEVLPHGLFDLSETRRTVGVRECKIGWIHPMGLSVRPLRDPELTTWGKSCIVANESAGATDGEQRRWNERFPPRSGRRFANALHSGFFHSHDRPPYACRRSMGCAVLAGEQHLICPMTSVELH